MKELKKLEPIVPKEEPKKRQIIIETDWNSITIVKSEASSMIELQAILWLLLQELKK